MTELRLNDLKPNKKAQRRKKRVGRGNASGRGTYSSRGLKGQRSRSGGKRGLKRRGLNQFLRNKPKIGGFKSLRAKMVTVNLYELEQYFESGELVNSKKLISKNIIKSASPGIKILGEGSLKKKLTVYADSFSESAKKAIMDAGGEAKLTGKIKLKVKKSK
jgi:large subunit ribosomal protein L15